MLPLLRSFDRAFCVFLQKARSAATSALQFRPCLWRFFAKGTVGCAPAPPFRPCLWRFFCKRHGRLPPPPCDFDRAFCVFLQKARSAATSAPQFRPCLWRFFIKGTVGRALCTPISTVPLAFFCKRHGRPCPLHSNFDRAFSVFLQKARSAAPSAPQFRPCLCRFFTKGTVGCTLCPAISTVPLAFFYKRHGRPHPLPRDFDRAFGVFLQKARSRKPHRLRFRPCLWRFFTKGTVGRDPCPAISTVPLTLFCKRHGRLRRLPRDFDRAFDRFL